MTLRPDYISIKERLRIEIEKSELNNNQIQKISTVHRSIIGRFIKSGKISLENADKIFKAIYNQYK